MFVISVVSMLLMSLQYFAKDDIEEDDD